jgi:hypothetical protein
MVIPRGRSEPNRHIGEYLDYRSDQGKRRKRCHDMQHSQHIYTSVSTKERARRRQSRDELNGPAVVLENRKKVLYVKVLKAIYGMLEAALLLYKTFRKDLEDNGFVFDPYDPCVAKKKVQRSQQTIVFHVDNLKSSHKKKKYKCTLILLAISSIPGGDR